jgi:hypothetical protein
MFDSTLFQGTQTTYMNQMTHADKVLTKTASFYQKAVRLSTFRMEDCRLVESRCRIKWSSWNWWRNWCRSAKCFSGRFVSFQLLSFSLQDDHGRVKTLRLLLPFKYMRTVCMWKQFLKEIGDQAFLAYLSLTWSIPLGKVALFDGWMCSAGLHLFLVESLMCAA